MTDEEKKAQEAKEAEDKAKAEADAKAKEEDKSDDDKTAEELEAEAKALEEENKKLKEEKGEDEIKSNQRIRLEKARAKNAQLKGSDKDSGDDIDTRDLITLGKNDIDEGSDKAKILQKYVDGGIIQSYKDGLDHPGVKAEFEAIDAKNNATSVVDENASEEDQMRTKKEQVAEYKASGEVPDDKDVQKAIVEDNLSEMNLD